MYTPAAPLSWAVPLLTVTVVAPMSAFAVRMPVPVTRSSVRYSFRPAEYTGSLARLALMMARSYVPSVSPG